MTQEAQKKHDEKLKRVNDAIALKEPDRVPITPSAGLFPVFNAGMTVAEVVYDNTLEKMRIAVSKYLQDFDPDTGGGMGFIYAGEGIGMELSRPKNMLWAGMPGDKIDKNSIQQFIEYPLLEDEELEEFFTDRTGWALKSLAKTSGLLEPFAGLKPGAMMGNGRMMAAQVSTPEFKAMMHDLWAIDEFYKEYQLRAAALEQGIRELGYPILTGGAAMVPYDMWSDTLRGTIKSMMDFYDYPEYMERYMDEVFLQQLERVRATKGINEGSHVFMALHKGMDGFMSDEQYRKYYWKHLQAIILEIIDSGHVPYIYTEGRYNSRLDCLAEVPAGKVIYHFETVDMALAKKKLSGIACIAGGFDASLLDWSTPEQVRDECKRLIDICAPGGGFMFETSCGLGNCKRENVEAMFETVREYGKY